MSNVMWRRNAVTALLAAVAATATDGALGFIAIFSIGLGLLITAGLFGVAALGLAPSAAQIAPLLAALTAVGLLIAGFTITGVF